MASISTRERLIASYLQATDPQVPKTAADMATVALMADIYHLLSYSDAKIRRAAESILGNKVLTTTQKLSVLKIIEPPAPHTFAPDLHDLVRINARQVEAQKKSAEIRKRELQYQSSRLVYEIGRTPRAPAPSDRKETKEQKRGDDTVSEPSPASASARPTAMRVGSSSRISQTASGTLSCAASEHPAVAEHVENSSHIPFQPRPLTRAASDSDDDSDSWMHFFQLLTLAAMVAYQASK